MKKHIIGFTIFSLIVSFAIFISVFFYLPENIDVAAPAVNSSSWKIKQGINKSKLPVIRQALLDLDTKQMSWDIYVPETDTPIALHFFVKESGGVRYLGSEVVPFISSSSSNEINYKSSSFSTYHPNSLDNIYVVPEIIPFS
ncbi:MAG: hypothetical protein ACR2L1_00435, partial [Pyrinomonadaceae bacterium]